MRIKDMNNKTRNTLEKDITENNIKQIVIHSEEPFIELYSGTVIWLDEIEGYIKGAEE